jgi:hypothetical protein
MKMAKVSIVRQYVNGTSVKLEVENGKLSDIAKDLGISDLKSIFLNGEPVTGDECIQKGDVVTEAKSAKGN